MTDCFWLIQVENVSKNHEKKMNKQTNVAIKILNNFEQCTSEYRAGVITNYCYHDL